MNFENISYPILNPDIYLNYLEPTVAREYEVTRNVYLVTLGALSWDILSSLPDDWRLIQTTKLSPVLLAYFASRTCAFAVVLMSTLGKTGPVENCGVMELILCIFWVLASAASSYLFLKRVHAVLFQDRIIRHCFTALWVGGVGASLVVLPGPLHDYYQIANTKHCTNTEIKSYVAAAFIVPVLFDALVFCAITYKILMFHRTQKPRNCTGFCCGEALPRFSKAVLQGGQQYYLLTTGVNVTRSIMAILPSIPPILQLAPSIPALAITSVMACRVFRNLTTEAIRNTEVAVMTTLHFATREGVDIPKIVHKPTEIDLEQVQDSLHDLIPSDSEKNSVPISGSFPVAL